MSRANIVIEELVEGNTSFFAVYIETKNAKQLFLSEGEDKLGTLAVAIPQPEKLVGPPPLFDIARGQKHDDCPCSS